MIVVTRVLTADNTDVLAQTELDQAPEGGSYEILAASSQNDTTISIELGGDEVVDTRNLPQRTNGVPEDDADRSFIIIASGGTRPVVAIDIVTAATVYVIITYVPFSEMS